MRRAYEFLQYELPNYHTWGGQLIKSLPAKYPRILAEITHIKGSTTLLNDLEIAVDFYL